MSEQLLIDRGITVITTKHYAATITEHRLSDPRLMILEFGWKMSGARCHLYREHRGDWKHLFKNNQFSRVLEEAQKQ